MKFKMKVNDFFHVGNKTIFTGEVFSDETPISNVMCKLKIGSKVVYTIKIEGEVLNNAGYHDLWTFFPIRLDRDILQKETVWLIAD